MRAVDIRTGAIARVVALANGRRTLEYEVENRDSNLQCWIAAETDKKVSIQWDFTAEHRHYQVDLFADGVFQDTYSGESQFPPGVPDIVHNLVDKGISIGLKDRMFRHQMFFQELIPHRYGKTSARPEVGTIELRIYHDVGNGVTSPPPCTQLARDEDLLEDVFAMENAEAKDPTHSILFKNRTRITRANAKKKNCEVFDFRPGISPWATFKFFYRSKGALNCVELFTMRWCAELHKAALASMGIILLPTPEDFSVRFRSRPPSPPSKALGSLIAFEPSDTPRQGASPRSSQGSESTVQGDLIVGNFIDSSRDPRLQHRNQTREVRAATQVLREGRPQTVGDGNVTEGEEKEDAVQRKESKKRGETMNNSEGSKTCEDGVVWNKSQQPTPRIAELTNAQPYGSKSVFRPTNMTPTSIFGEPSIIGRSRPHWFGTDNNLAVLELRDTPPSLQPVSTSASHGSQPSGDSQPDSQPGSSASYQLPENDTTVSQDSHKRRRSNTPSEIDSNGDSPEMKQFRIDIAILKQDLLKNHQERRQKMAKLVEVIKGRNQEIVDEISKVDRQLTTLEDMFDTDQRGAPQNEQF
ncbi:hypothetical protein FGG08_003886 [Glutinoglossum americanum]|uniref:Uncharacterized protein n=1 Tax=Glutinoglossum americanum TaxID=1670608 RepID=A0A9P8L057_9PEZI|nr:hypothetical protein FGG08_003886 [Glutinoglossum americanum]